MSRRKMTIGGVFCLVYLAFPAWASGQPGAHCYECIWEPWSWTCVGDSDNGYESCNEPSGGGCDVSGERCSGLVRLSPAGTLLTLRGVHSEPAPAQDMGANRDVADRGERSQGIRRVEDSAAATADCRGAILFRVYDRNSVDRVRSTTARVVI